MIQNTLQFKGNMVEVPNQHLKRFLQIYDIFKYNGVSSDAVFGYSHSHCATIRLIGTFKTILRKCPHHVLQAWLQIQIFYNSVDGHIKFSLDKASDGSLMFHTYERAYKIIEDMTINSYMWPNEIFMYKSKSATVKVVNEEDDDDRFQRILKSLTI
ncbi:casein kinase II subunit alpha, chloroplastic-like [Gossypium australe]|uniref:Casein kinase II subunit alpha, chloroplastic-like n=1 Tax=Gossypium australe TaxID=47621 RepID=A0A5B6VNY1_9ROSI|nr:casein kinase II subunit alpha, chloroplastic-like [Gossypium australe]